MEKKQVFEKSYNAEKLKGGPFGIFKHPMCCEISKKLKGGTFEDKKILKKKSHNAEKLKGGPLGFFNTHSVAKHQKIEGGPFGGKISEKVSQCQKKCKGGPFGLARYGMLRGKTGKTFLVQFARANGNLVQ